LLTTKSTRRRKKDEKKQNTKGKGKNKNFQIKFNLKLSWEFCCECALREKDWGSFLPVIFQCRSDNVDTKIYPFNHFERINNNSI
jgi:hypothetical protein